MHWGTSCKPLPAPADWIAVQPTLGFSWQSGNLPTDGGAAPNTGDQALDAPGAMTLAFWLNCVNDLHSHDSPGELVSCTGGAWCTFAHISVPTTALASGTQRQQRYQLP